jgi:hypothetical protein
LGLTEMSRNTGAEKRNETSFSLSVIGMLVAYAMENRDPFHADYPLCRGFLAAELEHSRSVGIGEAEIPAKHLNDFLRNTTRNRP